MYYVHWYWEIALGLKKKQRGFFSPIINIIGFELQEL